MTQPDTIASNKGPIRDATPELVHTPDAPLLSDFTLNDFLPILMALNRPRRYLTAHPTWTPKNLTDSIQFVKISTTYYVDFYINNAWYKVALTAV